MKLVVQIFKENYQEEANPLFCQSLGELVRMKRIEKERLEILGHMVALRCRLSSLSVLTEQSGKWADWQYFEMSISR